MKQAELFNLMNSFLNLMMRIEEKAVIQSEIDHTNTSVIEPMCKELTGLSKRIEEIIRSDKSNPILSLSAAAAFKQMLELAMLRSNLRRAFYASRN